jgi:multicomponent Na+:H+ antiporter subunit E
MIATNRGQQLRSWIWRGTAYYAFWVLLIGFKPVDLVVGIAAAAAATWASLVLLPSGSLRLRLVGLPRYGLHFLWQSVVAGIGVARLAFAPRLTLRTGLISYLPHYPYGSQRNVFASLTSLLPGTVALGDNPRSILYHCVDTGQPIVEQLVAEEAALSRVLPAEPRS